MLRCDYCGRENVPTARSCAECGCALTDPVTAAADLPELPQVIAAPEWIHLDRLPSAFTFEAGFSRLDWDLLSETVERSVPPLDRDAAWQEVAWQWLEQLRQDLGGDYRIRSSQDFLMLSNVSRETAMRVLNFAEQVVVIARESLADLAWRGGCGKQVILMFSEQDDYYEYISWFFNADTIPNSSGVHISRGFPHIALQSGTEHLDCLVVAHELVHNCLMHLPIPLWVNEGVAQRLERGITHRGAADSVSGPLMSHDMAERHHAFWNEENIQAFWAGTLFHAPGDPMELSYHLAEVLVHLLAEDRASFLDFLSRADYADAGQTAALDCLGKNLGDVVAIFLGEGHWRPMRKRLVECWGQQTPSLPS